MGVKFVLDGMLGRLARWLRIIGYDTAYQPDISDTQLIKTAKTEGRILITRDRELYRKSMRNNVQSHLLTSVILKDWLISLGKDLNLTLELESHHPRCSICNTSLQDAEPSMVARSLPDRLRSRYSQFWKCPTCEKIYWQGSHWQHMNEMLMQVNMEATSREAD